MWMFPYSKPNLRARNGNVRGACDPRAWISVVWIMRARIGIDRSLDHGRVAGGAPESVEKSEPPGRVPVEEKRP